MGTRKTLGFIALLCLLATLPQALFAVVPVSLATSGSPSTFGAPVVLTATISPAPGASKVTFYDGVTVLGTAPVIGSQAAITTILLPAGSRKLTAFFSGDGVNPAATSAVVTQVVNATPITHFGPPVPLL